MTRRSQLRREAAQLRGRIDRRACLVHQRVDSLAHQLRTLARSPAALPVAFAAGVLAQRMPVPVIKGVYQLLTELTDPMQAARALRIAAGVIGSPIR